MQKINEVLKSFKDELKGIMDTMLVSERMNSQRCIAKDVDTTKTIIDQKENENVDINEIEKLSDTVVADYRDKLNTRIKELLENPNEIDENRMAQEVAIYADKSSITEEIVRFNSHITQLKNTVVKDDSVGRKMDFLIQEMNREINTMGSKSSDINITNLVVEVKSELEKIREQIQNIE